MVTDWEEKDILKEDGRGSDKEEVFEQARDVLLPEDS